MRRTKRVPAQPSQATSGDQVGPLLGLIDYMRPEAGAVAPLAEYFLRMARSALLEAGQSPACRREGN